MSSTSSSSSDSMTILITGASRGFGRAIAKVACQHFSESHRHPLRLILVARSDSGLQETKELCSKSVVSAKITCHAMDLGDLDRLDENMDTLMKQLDNDQVQRIICINNAGTIGHLGPCKESPSLQDMRSNVDLNITSALWIAVRFCRHVQQQQHAASSSTMVNISSLVAIADFPTFGIYSAGKAARDKYHTLIAKEEEQGSKLKTLNYAPGPLETDMVEEIRSSDKLDANLKPNYQKKLLDTEDSAKKLIRLLDSNTFDSGAHIDYYDLQRAALSTGKPPSANRCVPLNEPISSKYRCEARKTKDAVLPDFHLLVNYPDYLLKARNSSSEGPNTPTPAGKKHCVMCGKLRVCSASTLVNRGRAAKQEESSAASQEEDDDCTAHIIPRQNKGLCTACDVSVWVFTADGLEIKWCKGCKNFRPWAAFGDKGSATKCTRCRDRQREKYALQKDEIKQRRYKRTSSSDSMSVSSSVSAKKSIKEEQDADQHLAAARGLQTLIHAAAV